MLDFQDKRYYIFKQRKECKDQHKKQSFLHIIWS
jgi:hypothetical protein